MITLTAIEQLLHDHFEVDKVLVIAPLRVAETTWLAEVAKWDHLKHLRVAKVLGNKGQRLKALATPADIYVTNRENTSWLVEHYGKNWPFRMVILDELSSFKSNKAKRFRDLRKVRPLIKRIVGLTGTPTPNGLLDLWPQMYLLDRGERLGKTITGYREQYFVPDKRNHHVIFSYKLKPDAECAIHQSIADICVSMKAADWITMPKRIDQTVEVALDTQARMKYQKLEQELILPLKEGADIVASSAAVLVNKLLQLANGAVYDENQEVQEIHHAKLDALEDLLEAANEQPVLVFYYYKHDLARIQKRFPKAEVLRTEKDVERWNQGKTPLLLAHPAAAGHGLNLQFGGHTIIWFGLTWSLELYQQANARLHRQGQERSVVVYHILVKDTVDEQVMKALRNKDTSQGALLAALKARI